MMNKYLPLCALILLQFISFSSCFSTHIRAGEIIAKRISVGSLKYRISVIAYTDTGSFIEFGGGELDFDDGTVVTLKDAAISSQKIDLGDEIAYNIFEIDHTFSGFGTYTIRFRERDRNIGVLNMSNSGTTPFYIETEIQVGAVLTSNNTPTFKVPPIDRAAACSRFIHNPGAEDEEGDSVSYKILIPKQDINNKVFNYLFPNDESFYENYTEADETKSTTPDFRIDAITGDLVWDAPGAVGEYNVAFMVEEWRKIEGEFRKIGHIVRDMQIIVEESDNVRPSLEVPEEICVEAGTLIRDLIVGTDPDGHMVQLEAFGGPFDFTNNPATYSPDPPIFQENPGILSFEWQTSCDHVRQRPYSLQFKVTDLPDEGPKLVDFKTWNITVVAPAPTGLNASIETGNSMKLEWDPYSCGAANQMQIWRRVDHYALDRDECLTGIPAHAGYELIETIDEIIYRDADGIERYKTEYIDNNGGVGLAPGADYCYRIVAQFPQPRGGESYASTEACAIFKSDAPVLVNVDVTSTNKTDGNVYLRWYSPFLADASDFPGPFRYEIRRIDGELGNLPALISSISDTTFIDSGLNTLDELYWYSIRALDRNGQIIGTTPFASVVTNEISPSLDELGLRWTADVPWSNSDQDNPWHYIFRDHVDAFEPDSLILIDSVDVIFSGFRYSDSGQFNSQPLQNSEEYCYYVMTSGSYGNAEIIEPLFNRSAITCDQLDDLVVPCTPISLKIDDAFQCETFLAEKECGFSEFSNKITWEYDLANECDDDVRSFNIYYSFDGKQPFELIANVASAEFTHEGIDSFKGCYKISAVDRSGNESEISQAVCNDNCPRFLMPNVFTPNGDQVNETFGPYSNIDNGRFIPNFDHDQCPRFVESVVFNVFDRTGGPVFTYNSGDLSSENPGEIEINWKGTTNSGIELPAGVYFYSAEVQFDVLNDDYSRKTYTGWVHLLR